MRSGLGLLAQNLRHHTSLLITGSRANRIVTPVSSGDMIGLPERITLVVFDLDGVVYRGHEPIRGARELVAALHLANVEVRFATNNSMVARAGYVQRLAGMGIHTTVDEIVTSTSATIQHLRRHAPDVRSVLAVGAEGMETELSAAGLHVVMAGDTSMADHDGGRLERAYDAVIVGLDPHVDYRRLAVAMRAVGDGARLVATNADARYPTAVGFLPGAGSIVAAIETATGTRAEVIGKPSPAMFTAILEATGVPATQAVVIGDNPDADVVGAHRAGCAAILVLTGVADAALVETLDGERRPDAVAEDPAGVLALIEPRLS